MAPGSQRQEEQEPRRDPEVAHSFRCASESDRRVRLSVPVPRVVDAVLSKSGRDAESEIDRVIAALFRKLRPERGPSPYAGEVHYFQRLINSPTEALTPAERLFVLVNRMHEELIELTRKEEGSDVVRREVEHASGCLAELVEAAQEIVRIDRGEDTAQLEWEITEP